MNRTLIGIVCIVAGVFFLWFTYKYSLPKDSDIGGSNVKGYIAGFGFLILGILTLLGYGDLAD
ncbi:MAG: hypothetical protein ABI315_04835 [Bacteroidia bacterium]